MDPKDPARLPLCDAIRRRREALGHGLREAATAMDYRSSESVRNLEGGRIPRERNVAAIARYLRWSQRRLRVAIAQQRMRRIEEDMPR